MTPPARFRPTPNVVAASAIAVVVALAATSLPGPVAAQAYARALGNDLGRCAAGQGPAVRVEITGLKSAQGNLFVRTYAARREDWLKSKRYLTRIDASPRKGSVTVCVPLPAAGDYAIAVQHDVNGNRETDIAIDGAGMSNNPAVKSFLGIPRPPAVGAARFSAADGITRIAIAVRYRD